MTSEIAVMNQRAVALAADSAVTLIDGGTVVVRNDQRKLYNLLEGRPVGVMFFGVADIMGHPWEHLIEHYQKKAKPKPFAHLNDYAASFTATLDHLEEFFPADRQKDDYKRLLASVYRYVFHLAQYLRETGDERISDGEILAEAIARIWHDYQFKEDGSPRADLACFPQGFGAKVASEHGLVIDELIAYGFAPFQLAENSVRQLKDIAVYAVVKDLFLEDVTGLVFAGFGTEDRYPVCVTYLLSSIVCGIVKRAQASVDVIDTEIRSKIRMFADSEVTHAFIRGIDFGLERRVYGAMRMMLHALVDQVVGAFPDADAARREEVRKRFQDGLVPQYLDAFRSMIGDYQQQAYINPVLRVLEIAARTELAETARELVSLNVFKKRIMAQKQTVGGAIDVAVISREGGFQWFTKQDGAWGKMPDPFKFDTTPRSGALADGAERLGRLASAVKDQQLSRVQPGPRRAESEVYVASPEEAWSKKYMIQCVGPVCTVRPTDAGALLLPRFQPVPEAQAPARSVEIAPAAAPAATPERLPARKGRAGAEQIGVLIGKPVRRRSLLGRMFGR